MSSFITYPLKTTAALPLDVIFEQFISQTYGEQLWHPIKNEISKISKLRGEFYFEQQNITNANDPSCAKLSEKLISYYKYLLFLQTKFRFEYTQQGSIKIPFQWSSSFDSKKVIATPSLIFEKASILYNLAVLYYTEASSKMLIDSMEERKLANQKFRFCLWCISQIKQLAVSIAPEIKAINSDLGDANLDIIYHTSLGNCYQILFTNLLDQERQLKSQNIGSLAQEASFNYTIALSKANQLIQSGDPSIPQEHLLKVKAYLFFNSVKYNAIAGFKMSTHHQDRQEDDIKGGHIGWALGYVTNSLNGIQKALANENVMKYLDKSQIKQLQDLKSDAEKLYAPLNQRNQQIYKQEVPDERKLPRSSLLEQLVIQPVQPKEIDVGLQINVDGFNNFMNEDALQLVQEIRQFAQLRNQEAEGVQKQIIDMKNTAYLENYVNFFIELLSQKNQQQVPQKINDKINKYNQLGGAQKLQNFVNTLKESNKQCGLLLHNIKSKIDSEANDDTVTRAHYGAKWTRTASVVTNKDYLAELKNLEDNFKTACSIEMDNQQRWAQNQETVNVISRPSHELIQYFTTGSSEENFKKQNFQQLCQLENANQEIERQVGAIKQFVSEINNAVRNMNYQGEVSKAQQNKIPKDKILETVLQGIQSQIVALNDVITQFSTKVSEACGIALDLQQRRNQGNGGSEQNLQQSEKHSSGLNTLIELFDDCQQGLKFYQDLTSLVLDLDKKVSDFLSAREIEKNNLIQMIHQDQSKAQAQATGFNAPYPVYNPPPTQFQQPQQFQYQQNPYQPPHPYQQMGQQNMPQPYSNQPFFQNGQFGAGGSTYIPKK